MKLRFRRWHLVLVILSAIGCVGVLGPLGVVTGGSDGGSIDVDGGADGGAPHADAGTDGGAPDSGSGPPVGRAVVGCADAGDPTLSALERRLITMPADSWHAEPNTKLYDVCKLASAYGDGVYLVGGCAMLTAAWNSGAWDSQRQQMVVWGGGHNDYGGNELYAFDVHQGRWRALTQPSRPPFDRDPLDDGRPVSRHTYDGFEFIAHRGTLFGWGGAQSTSGNGTDVTWEFRPDESNWVNLRATPPGYSSPYDFGLAYDRVSKKVFLHAHAILSSFDFETNTWAKLKDFGYPPFTQKYDTWLGRTGAVDPVRRLFVTLGSGPDVMAYNIDTNEVVSLSGDWASVPGGAGTVAGKAPGIDYDAAAATFVAWSGGAPAALDTTTWRWVARSAVGAPTSQTNAGTYGRWRYAERYNVFILVNSTDDDVRFYKHTGGCGGE